MVAEVVSGSSSLARGVGVSYCAGARFRCTDPDVGSCYAYRYVSRFLSHLASGEKCSVYLPCPLKEFGLPVRGYISESEGLARSRAPPARRPGVVSGRLLPTNHQPYESYPTEAVTSRRASPLLCASSTAPTGSDVRRPLTVTESGNSAKTTRREDPYSNLVMAQDLLNESRETSQESYSHCSEANRARVSSSLPVLEGVLIDNPFGADRYEVAEVPFVDHGVGKGCLGLSPALRVQHRQEEIQAGRREASAPSEGGDGGHAWLGAGSAFERDSTQMQNAETARSDTHWMPAVMSVPGEPLLDIYSQQIAPSVTEEENASERLCLPSKSDCGFVGTSNWKVARGQEGHIEWAARDDWSDPSASLSSSRDVEWGTKTVAKGVRHPVWGENCGEEEIMNRRPLEGRRLPVQSNSDGCSPESTFGWTRYAPSGAAPEESASSLQEADVTGMNAENVDDGVYRKVRQCECWGYPYLSAILTLLRCRIL